MNIVLLPTTQLLTGADPDPLGRVDISSLPDQDVMELLLNTPEANDGSRKRLTNIHKWQGVCFDNNSKITQIHWYNHLIERNRGNRFSRRTDRLAHFPIDLHWIPTTVEKVSMRDVPSQNFSASHLPRILQYLRLLRCSIAASIDTNALPRGLTGLFLEANKLFGTVDWQHLPHEMRKVYLTENELSGNVHCSRLPRKLEELHISHNHFSGSIDTHGMPESLIRFVMRHNMFYGYIELTMGCSAAGSRGLFISHNQFKGPIRYIGKGRNSLPEEIDFDALRTRETLLVPPRNQEAVLLALQRGNANIRDRIVALDCSSNHFTSIDWESMTLVDSLDASQNKIEGVFDVRNIPKHFIHLDISQNILSGGIDLRSIPAGLKAFAICDNLFSGGIDLTMDCLGGSEDGGLSIKRNRFSGAIRYVQRDDTAVNESIRLHCAENLFTSIDWASLHRAVYLDASKNDIAGSLDMLQIPPGLRYLNVSENQISGSLNLEDLVLRNVVIREIHASSNRLTGSLDLRNLPQHLDCIELCRNKLGGTVKFGERIPTQLSLMSNPFSVSQRKEIKDKTQDSMDPIVRVQMEEVRRDMPAQQYDSTVRSMDLG